MGTFEIVWTEADIEHIARHGVTPEEVEEAVAGAPRLSMYALGQSEAGRYLFVVLSPLGRRQARCVTARDMDTRNPTTGNHLRPIRVQVSKQFRERVKERAKLRKSG